MKRNKFGSIRKLASGKYQVRYFRDGIQQTARTLENKPLTFSTERDARLYLVHLESDLAKGLNPYDVKAKKSYTIRERVEMYLDPTSGARLSGKPLRISTLRGYRHLADNYIYRELGNFCLADVELSAANRADVMKWYQLIQAQCVENEIEIKTRAHPARIWARELGLISSIYGRISPELKAAWIDAGAPIVRKYKTSDSGAAQLAKAYTLLKSVFNVALDDELITANPCRIKGAGQRHSAERPTATPEQVAALAAEVPGRYSMAVLLAAYSSMRSSELFGLQRKHINPLHRSITIEHQLASYSSDSSMFVDTKTDSSVRTVFIAPELMGALIEHLELFTGSDPDDLVFTTSTHLPLFKGRKSWFVTAKRRLGLDHLHFHDLRHTGQTLAMERGATIKDLQRRAGQSSEIAARIYLHGNAKRDQIVADSLSDDVRKSLEIIKQIKVS
jgi:integrase